jgi:hypothetical protein
MVSCGYYLRKRHGLIHRHTETVELQPDHTARWQLRIDFELPSDEEARWREDDGTDTFLFPLVFLKKASSRVGFEVRDESGDLLTVPVRTECDRISSFAAAHASESMHASIHPPPEIPLEGLREVFEEIAADKPFESSLALHKVLGEVGLEGDREISEANEDLGKAWEEKGLLEVLHMLVDHSLIWVPLKGKAGERRTIVVSQEISMVRRVFLRWIFGDDRMPDRPCRHPLKARRARRIRRKPYLKVGDRRYGRRTFRISFSALGERIGQPLGWMPFEYEFPTVYTKRCQTYHFELICPPGRGPRELRPARAVPLAEPRQFVKRDDGTGSTILTSHAGRHDRKGAPFPNDLWFRVTVGVGDGAFPALWFLAGAITALMLWLIAGYASVIENGDEPQITAAILLVVPAIVAALAIGENAVPVTQVIGGARILLLVIGLSAVMATAVLIEAEPFDWDPVWTWTACAMVVTAATVPLATGWLLSSAGVWRQMKKLKTRQRQKHALWIGVALALAANGVLILACDGPVDRGIVGVALVLLTVGMTALANNRMAMQIGEERRYIAFSLMLAALTCLVLGCIELQAAVGGYKDLHEWAEHAALPALAVSLFAGELFSKAVSGLAPKGDEIHVSPEIGRALLRGEAVRELAILREREVEAEKQNGLQAEDRDGDRTNGSPGERVR